MEGQTQLETALNVRWLLIVLEFPGIYDAKNMLLLYRVLDKAVGIRKDTEERILMWVNEYSEERFRRVANNLKRILNTIVLFA